MGRYPENTGIKDLILLGRTSESTPRFLREGNETCEILRTVPPAVQGSWLKRGREGPLGQRNETCERFLHMISAEAVDKEEELCLFSREQR